MRFLALGSTQEIGASCYYVRFRGTADAPASGVSVVLDAGMDPEHDGLDALPSLSRIAGRRVDHTVVTHAHHDHLGALPILVKQHPETRVHMSRPTRMLADILLPSSAKLQRRRQLEGSTTAAPLFDEELVEALAYLYEVHELETPFALDDEDEVLMTFYHAGHVLGAVGVLFEVDDAAAPGGVRTVFYTSDTNLRPQLIQPGGDYPEGPIDVLILESTLAADPEAETTTRKEQQKALGEAIRRTLARGGSVLIPVFALGRSQEVLALLDQLKRRRVIPADTPVYTTGQMRAIADAYDKTRFTSPRLDEEFQVFGVQQQRLPRGDAQFEAILAKPGIHVASSGMLFERTLSNKLAQRFVEDEKNGIFFVGFNKEDSPGARLVEAAEGQDGQTPTVTLDKERGPQKVRAEVGRYRFSGHSHRRDLLRIVEMLQPKKVLLVHGETEARGWMKDNIEHFFPGTEVILPEHGVEIEV